MKKDKDWLSEQVGELNSTDAVLNESGLPYIDTVVSIERVFDLIYQLDEPEKVVVPEFVGEWLTEARDDSLYGLLERVNHLVTTDYKWREWWERKVKGETFSEVQSIIAKAVINGYNVEKEPKYYVYLGDGHYLVSEDDLKEPHAKIRHQEDRGFLNYNTTFTEQEIKDYDPRYWAFRNPVEELAND